ncbi:hypothetical protein B0H21DRAFT_780137 [Amylocystis lapponica]|nr:hypothetical protein B0H21DRAFT_780137 [Amylocystis lapponica]
MHHTPWTQKTSSPTPKGKAKQEPPKSEQVRQLEKLRDDLRRSQGQDRDPKGGCFCQARLHDLSAYTPICRTCGLVLCTLNLPHFACPHCAAPLHTPSARDALLQTLESQVAETLAREEAARERAAWKPVRPQALLSLNSKTKKVTVSSYVTPPATRPSSHAAAKEVEQQQQRVPAPPPEVVFAPHGPIAGRPWANLRGGSATYVPADSPTAGNSDQSQKTGGEHKKKGKENQGRNERV